MAMEFLKKPRVVANFMVCGTALIVRGDRTRSKQGASQRIHSLILNID